VKIVVALPFTLCAGFAAASPDIAVYSSVPCGIAASITAAREGAKVVLIER
jgi:NADPH-dependent 2,4-dienoyl-CoA reductase/sulfur reductase-like enzyme